MFSGGVVAVLVMLGFAASLVVFWVGIWLFSGGVVVLLVVVSLAVCKW